MSWKWNLKKVFDMFHTKLLQVPMSVDHVYQRNNRIRNQYKNILFTCILSYIWYMRHGVALYLIYFWKLVFLVNSFEYLFNNNMMNSQLLLDSILQHKAKPPNHHVEKLLLYYFLLWRMLGPMAQYDFEN